MTALAKDRKTDKLGTEDNADPLILAIPVAASTKIYGGSMVAVDANGRAVPASANSALKLMGRCEELADNSSGAAAAIKVFVRRGVFYFNNGTGANAIAQANLGALAYASDDNTVNLTDGAGLYPAAGVIMDVRADGQIGVWLGAPSLYQVPTSDLNAASTQFKARAVITTALAAYTAASGVITANATGAIGSVADGVTLANGDVVLLPEGIAAAAADAGPYVVTNIGGTGVKFVLTRPDWWATGSTIQQGAIIQIGGEGSTLEGSQWKTFVAKGKLVDTDAPLLWPKEFRKTITLASGTYTIGAGGGGENLWLRSTTRSMVDVTRNTAGTSTATTGGYASPVASRTAGVAGTGACLVQAQVAAGTISNADVSTLDVVITNW